MTQTTPTRDEAVPFPAYGELPFSELGSAVKAAQFGAPEPYEFDPEFYPGHQIVGAINFNSLNRIVTWFVKRASAPAPASGGVGAVAVKPTVEQIARAICRGRDLNPDCQNQGAARDGTVDGNWPEPRENFGRPYDTRWHYGWRNQAKAAQAVLELLDSLSPAATPVSEAKGEADMRRVCEALGFDPTNHHNAAKCPYCTPALAKPASSTAGGDVVLLKAMADGAGSMLLDVQRECIELRQIVVGFLQCPEIADCAPEDKDPETDVLERRALRAALSQSTSAGRGE